MRNVIFPIHIFDYLLTLFSKPTISILNRFQPTNMQHKTQTQIVNDIKYGSYLHLVKQFGIILILFDCIIIKYTKINSKTYYNNEYMIEYSSPYQI